MSEDIYIAIHKYEYPMNHGYDEPQKTYQYFIINDLEKLREVSDAQKELNSGLIIDSITLYQVTGKEAVEEIQKIGKMKGTYANGNEVSSLERMLEKNDAKEINNKPRPGG